LPTRLRCVKLIWLSVHHSSGPNNRMPTPMVMRMCTARYKYQEVEKIYKRLRERRRVDRQKTNNQTLHPESVSRWKVSRTPVTKQTPGTRLHDLRRRGISLLGLLQRSECILRSRLPSEAFGFARSRTQFNAIHC
jgi:hypothetical protein